MMRFRIFVTFFVDFMIESSHYLPIENKFQFQPPFEVSGFSVFGTVQLSPGSKLGIAQADVLVNGKKVTTTDKDGKFVLEKMTVGDYFVRIEKKSYGFEASKVHFSPSKPELENIYVSRRVSFELKIVKD